MAKKDKLKIMVSSSVYTDIAHVVFLTGLIDKLGRGTLKVIEDSRLERYYRWCHPYFLWTKSTLYKKKRILKTMV